LEWYLVRTKSGKERWVSGQLLAILPEVFLPMLEARTQRWGKLVWAVMPLFPCYVFARFDLQTHYFDVKYMAGVQGIVSAGCDPLTVPLPVVEEIKRRGVNGVVKIEPEKFDKGERVRVAEGPFRGFEAIFERYLSGAERVAILLSTVEANGLRVVLPSSTVVKYS
jgi:transcriptional antiterminator RfaH